MSPDIVMLKEEKQQAGSFGSGSMKKRVAGGVVVGAILLGMYLANFWKGPGIGGEGDDVSVAPANDTVSVSVSPTQMTPAEHQSASPEYLNVVVHGSSYRLPIGDDLDTGLDVPLGTVIARANETKGTESGIRVRVSLERSAQEGALADLYSALVDKGISQGEIQEVSGYLD